MEENKYPIGEDNQLKFSIERGDLWKARALSAEKQLEELKRQPEAVREEDAVEFGNQPFNLELHKVLEDSEKEKERGLKRIKHMISARQILTLGLFEFVKSCAEDWDHDRDAHIHDTMCRKCDANKLYEDMKQQKEK